MSDDSRELLQAKLATAIRGLVGILSCCDCGASRASDTLEEIGIDPVLAIRDVSSQIYKAENISDVGR